MFVTRLPTSPAFGGIAGGDAYCQSAAEAAGLTGTYRAWLSDDTIDARDRFAGTSGWVRVDGAPVASTITRLLDQREMFNPILVDETGAGNRVGSVWTGTGVDGRRESKHCDNWSGTSGAAAAGYTFFGVGAFSMFSPSAACTNPAHGLLCFEIGGSATVTAVKTSGRVAFVSSTRRTAGDGVAGLDSICQSDAGAGGLSGSFLAAVTTSAQSIASRFTIDARPWVRPDGTLIAAPAALFDGSLVTSFINQEADGTYVDWASNAVWTGASGGPMMTSATTCIDWTSIAPAVSGIAGFVVVADPGLIWNASSVMCSNPALRVVCLEQ